MRTLSLSVCVVLCLFVTATASAQNKFAHVNFQELFTAVPDYKMAEDSLKKTATNLQVVYQQLQEEYQKKGQEFEANKTKWAPALIEIKIEEIKALEQKIVQWQSESEQKLAAKEAELTKPLHEKIVKAVNAVAKENGYTYVFDSTPGTALIVYPDGDNISALVKKKLGVQ